MDGLSLLRTFISLTIAITALLIFPCAYGKSGCCSWHHGVAYCDGTSGKIVCNDETYSPTCTCEQKSNASNRNSNEKDLDNGTDDYHNQVK